MNIFSNLFSSQTITPASFPTILLSLALALGLPTQYLKLLMAVIFTIALVLSGKLKLAGKKAK